MNIVKTAAVIVAVTLVGRLIGFIRTMYISHLYGTTMEVDAFFAALTIPATMFLVIPGAINAVLIPALSWMLEKEEKEKANELYGKLFTIVLAVFSLISALGIYFADWLVYLIFGFTGELAAQTTAQLRWMFPSVLFIGITGLWSSICNAHKHFFTPTLGTVTNGLIVILAFYLLIPLWGSIGLAVGTTLGYLAAMVTIYPTLRNFGYKQRLSLAISKDEELRAMGERVVPILIGAAISQATTFLERGLTAGLGEGKIAALGYANQIAQLPMAIFVGAFTLPLFPLLSSFAKRGEMDQLKATLQKGLAYLLILLLPVSVGLILYGEPLIRLVFVREGGEFGATAVGLTVTGLAGYSAGLFALGARDLITRAYYALEDTKTPVMIGVAGIAVYLVTAWGTMPTLGHGGVALSASVSPLVQSILLYLFLWRKIGQPLRLHFLGTTAKAAVATAVMSGYILFIQPWLAALPLWLSLLAGAGSAAILYFAVLALFREPLVGEILERLLRKAKRKPAA